MKNITLSLIVLLLVTSIGCSVSAKTSDTPTILIAANDSTAKAKSVADYICDGIDDQVEIQLAIDAIPVNGGELFFLAGEYICGSAIRLDNRSNITLRGEGYASFIRSIDNANWYYPDADALIDCTNVNNVLFENLRLLMWSNNGAAECLDGDRAKSLVIDKCWLYIKERGAALRFDGEAGVSYDCKLINSYIYSNNMGINIMAKVGGSITRVIIAHTIFQPWEKNGLYGADPAIMLGHSQHTSSGTSKILMSDLIIGGEYKFWPAIAIHSQCSDLTITSSVISSIANGIQFFNPCNRVIITGNNLHDVKYNSVQGADQVTDLIYTGNIE